MTDLSILPAGATQQITETLKAKSLSVVLVGLMGTGKSLCGRKLAERLELKFVDSDREIERAAGCPINDIFAYHGESRFRELERRVIVRLLCEKPCVLSLGGGAFVDPEIRKSVQEKGLSIWLRASLELMVKRTARIQNRPLLQGANREEVLSGLSKTRDPIHATANIEVESEDGPAADTIGKMLVGLFQKLHSEGLPSEGSKEPGEQGATS